MMGEHEVADHAGVAHVAGHVADAKVLHPRDCVCLRGIRGRSQETVNAWVDSYSAAVVPLNLTDEFITFAPRTRPTALRIVYAPDDVAYVLVGQVEGRARVADVCAALEWVPQGTVTGHGLAYAHLPPPTLWTWVTPADPFRFVRFPLLAKALTYRAKHGGMLLSSELAHKGDGKREFFVTHPDRLLAWTRQFKYAYGMLGDHDPCRFYADLDADYEFAPEMRDRALAEAETWRIVDAAVALLGEWGVPAARADFCFFETRRETKFSVHVLSGAFHFETEWLARKFGAELSSRLMADPAAYKYTFVRANEKPEVRGVLDPAVYIRHSNFRFLAKYTSDGNKPNYPVPWHHTPALEPERELLRGIPTRIDAGSRRVGYDTVNIVGKTYLELLNISRGPSRAHPPQPARSLASSQTALPPPDDGAGMPDWYREDAMPVIASMGFEAAPTRFDDDSILVKIVGVLPGHTGLCPVHKRVHTKGARFKAIYAWMRRDYTRWKCKKTTW